MLAVVGQHRLATRGKRRRRSRDLNEAAEAANEEAVLQHVANLRESLPHRHQARVRELVLGPGTGIAYLPSPRLSIADEDGIFIAFCGQLDPPQDGHANDRESAKQATSFHNELAVNSVDANSDAHRILHLYKEIQGRKYDGGGTKDCLGSAPCNGKTGRESVSGHHFQKAKAAEVIGQLKGSFAFVLYDLMALRVVAARDNNGSEPLCWGAPTFGDGLLFSTDRSLVEEEAADADDFPPGTFFVLSAEDGTNGTGLIIGFDNDKQTGSDTPGLLDEAEDVSEIEEDEDTDEEEEKYSEEGEEREDEDNIKESSQENVEWISGPMPSIQTEAEGRGWLTGGTPPTLWQTEAQRPAPQQEAQYLAPEPAMSLPVSPRTAFQVAMASAAAATAATAVAAATATIVTRPGRSKDGAMCRPASGENLALLAEAMRQIPSK